MAVTVCVRGAEQPQLLPGAQEGLQGNRVVQPDLWAMVCALARAFPVLLGPTMEAVATAQPGAAEDPKRVLHLWLWQVLSVIRCNCLGSEHGSDA